MLQKSPYLKQLNHLKGDLIGMFLIRSCIKLGVFVVDPNFKMATTGEQNLTKYLMGKTVRILKRKKTIVRETAWLF